MITPIGIHAERNLRENIIKQKIGGEGGKNQITNRIVSRLYANVDILEALIKW